MRSKKNTSYAVGTTHSIKDLGEVKITGYDKVNKIFIVKTDDGGMLKYTKKEFYFGGKRRPLTQSVCGIGTVGDGKYKASTREYKLWSSMLYRCTSGSNPTYKDCSVDPRWHNFQTFCEDIQKLEGYYLWAFTKNRMDLDKDIKIPGNKIYSKDTCMFVGKAENIRFARIGHGKPFMAERLDDGYKEGFDSQASFSKKYGVSQSSISNCIRGKAGSAKGWKFYKKEETNNERLD